MICCSINERPVQPCFTRGRNPSKIMFVSLYYKSEFWFHVKFINSGHISRCSTVAIKVGKGWHSPTGAVSRSQGPLKFIIKKKIRSYNNKQVRTSHCATALGGAGSQAIDGWWRCYLSPALEVIHSSPWHKLEKQWRRKTCFRFASVASIHVTMYLTQGVVSKSTIY